ncbi:hypothetical protein DYB28_010461 [Aphanomyces astaci]|uniref:Peptidyl-prolyl cis-trans isomerase n=1 Tax=Aphanomyces astaci TaxID=112090 RepID=A0A397D6Y3_APHAT|nr:hypothetical protein AaE_002514 [Aphanomyces astaci]RHY02349.1 hypothetical protein DYB36_011057 [Aphanomyces astaci]RHY05634.1 hypothetical protein DYB25_010079 [Aphanomyces astaci]RHY50709.1 hypothetical protein DYB38_009316 [Aphanomyces astaci]RHY59221.1 hypothetical protein DYB30_004346 [Aphanomyces astaci]
MSSSHKEVKLPSGWTRIDSKSRPGECYYLNKASGEKTWKLADIPTKESSKRKRSSDDSTSEANKKHSPHTHVQVLHLLVKHVESKRPASWRQDPITRSKDVARSRLEGLRDQIVLAGKNPDAPNALRDKFQELATTESDCSSAKRGGDLGKFTRGKMQPSFEKASFALRVGELSGVVESDSGVHIILRIK